MVSQIIDDAVVGNSFEHFRLNTIGNAEYFNTPFGRKPLIYADWVASGRLYAPIEEIMMNSFGPFVGNTHTETSVTGTVMTTAYHQARTIIKDHVNASETDCLISFGSGMTSVVNKLQRILGLRLPEKLIGSFNILKEDRPIVFVTHMEHHSNHTSWLETIADVECIDPDIDGNVDINHLEKLLIKYKNRPLKIASVTACSNVTGIFTPYHSIAGIMHKNGGLCFVDFACSAPYVSIDMHPENKDENLDAIFFSPHKFLGGPGTPGILIFASHLDTNKIPDNPGGGTVKWTNPWHEHSYIDNIEDREDGGTPPFLQTIRAALCIKLKDKMGSAKILAREHTMIESTFKRMEKINGLYILAGNVKDRLGVISFYIEGLHFNLGVKLLNDHFGIQVRGGCSCAGTYGHYLLNVSQAYSKEITSEIEKGNLTTKPGWIRLSLHPTMNDEMLDYILSGIEDLAINHVEWGKEYTYQPEINEFKHNTFEPVETSIVDNWFNSPL